MNKQSRIAPVAGSGPSPDLGPATNQTVGADFSPVSAPASLPMVECGDCGGTGEAWWMALDSTRYELGHCNACDGTGLVDPACHRCEGPLTATGWCPDCEENLFTEIENLGPGRIAA